MKQIAQFFISILILGLGIITLNTNTPGKNKASTGNKMLLAKLPEEEPPPPPDSILVSPIPQDTIYQADGSIIIIPLY